MHFQLVLCVDVALNKHWKRDQGNIWEKEIEYVSVYRDNTEKRAYPRSAINREIFYI